MTEPLETAVPTRIRSIKVDGLFGYLDHSVQLRHEERVTIVIGPNGVGKTHLLQLVSALFNNRPDVLLGVPFKELEVKLDDGARISVEQSQGQEAVTIALRLADNEATPNDSCQLNRRKSKQPEHDPRKVPKFYKSIMKKTSVRLIETQRLIKAVTSPDMHVPPWIEFIPPDYWIDRRTDRAIDPREVMLYHGRPPGEPHGMNLAVRWLAADLAERIKKVQQRYQHKTATLDRSYVQRYLSYEAGYIDQDKLQSELDTIANRQKELEQLGVLSADSTSQTQTSTVPRDRMLALALWANDMDAKLSILEPLASKIARLIAALNRKLQMKELVSTEKNGLCVRTSVGQGEFQLDKLSSGEQHELVLLYSLLFTVPANALVMIDEPELSLHPLWQQLFVDDIVAIAKDLPFDVLLATHSPYILEGRSAWAEPLRFEAESLQ